MTVIRMGSDRLWGRAFICLLFLLLWMPSIGHAITVLKFVGAQQYGLSVRAYYQVYNMAPSGAVSGGGGIPEVHVFPYNAIQINNYNSIFEKYVVTGAEALPNGMGAYDPINDPIVTNSFQLGPKVPLGFTQSGQPAFFRTVTALPGPEITVRYSYSQNILTGGTVSFLNTEVGAERTLTYQIINTGSKPLTGISVSVVESQDFTISQQPAATLASEESTSFIIKFRPSGAGLKTGTLRIASNDADENPFSLTLSGTATGGQNSSIQIVGSSGNPLANGSGVQNFGSTAVQSTVSRSLTISNNGNVALSGISVTLTGAHAGDFSVTPLGASTLQAGGVMPLLISFTPTAPGTRNATISVASSALTNNPYVFQLTGSAITPITFDSWIQGTTLVGADAEPGATPFNDGVPNLLKYAFNLNPNGPDSRILTTGIGTAGLPLLTVSRPGAPLSTSNICGGRTVG